MRSCALKSFDTLTWQVAFKERKMRRSASGSRVSDQFSQAKPSHSRSMSRSQSVRLVEDAELHLPRYDPSSQSGKREEKSRSRSAENVVHFIPLLLLLCVIILWLFSRSGKPFVLGLIGSMWLILFCLNQSCISVFVSGCLLRSRGWRS